MNGLGNEGGIDERLYDEDDGWPRTSPVGAFDEGKTRDGIFDLAGNVSEWTGTNACDLASSPCERQDEWFIFGSSYGTYDPDQVESGFAFKSRSMIRTTATGFRCASDVKLEDSAVAQVVDGGTGS